MAAFFLENLFSIAGHVLNFDAEIVDGMSPELASEGDRKFKSKFNAM